jgi:threonine/homoserine/homoserine lactone efflux protein
MGMIFGNSYGIKKAVRFCLGVGTGYFFVMLVCCYLNFILADIMPDITLVMKILGSIYMLYLAYKIITSKDSNGNNTKIEGNIFFTAILLQFINPKGILSGITLATTFILPYHNSHLYIFILSLLIAISGFLATYSWSLFGSVFQKFLATYRTPFNIVMALSLVYISISIFLEQ